MLIPQAALGPSFFENVFLQSDKVSLYLTARADFHPR